ncbi:two-component regulator propeller domain-containing protein [Magnetococcus sp. PR-3]|uniref:two-component regulator propeller domain-containing protein n=1 Tax=Magnetococcus sp. PR-3 TaxID=3120355 RepID=UPI002FCDF68F
MCRRNLIVTHRLHKALWIILLPWLSSFYPHHSLADGLVIEPKFNHIRSEHGLSNNEITDIVQDTKGFLWFGTLNGLNRYDGHTFRTYSHQPDNINTLAGNYIWSMTSSKTGHLWIGYWGHGVSRFDPSTETFVHLQHNPEDPTSISHNNIWHIMEDRHGGIWIATDQGINHIAPLTLQVTRYLADPTNPHSISNKPAMHLLEDQQGMIWVAFIEGGVNRLDPKTGRALHFRHDANDPTSLQNNIVTSLYNHSDESLLVSTLSGMDAIHLKTLKLRHITTEQRANYRGSFLDPGSEISPGKLWMGGNAGLDILDIEQGQRRTIKADPDRPSGVSASVLWKVFKDRDGGVWLATENGVDHYQPNRLSFRHFFHNPYQIDSLNSNLIYALHQDHQGNIWVGSEKGLQRFDLQTGKALDYPLNWNLEQPNHAIQITHITSDSTGNLWVASQAGLQKIPADHQPPIHYWDGAKSPYRKLADNFIQALAVGDDGTVWLGSKAGGLTRIDGHSGHATTIREHGTLGTSFDWLNDLMIDKNGILWAATENGVNRYNPTTNQITRFLHNPKDPTSISSHLIRTIFEDQQGRFWLATNQGLDLFDPKQGRIRNIAQSDGIPSNLIQSIQQDSTGKLWLGTDQGLASYHPQTGEIRRYDESQGVQGLQFYRHAALSLNDGTLLMGGGNGFNHFLPHKQPRSQAQPHVVLTDFKLFNQAVEIGPGHPLGRSITYTDAVTLNPEQSTFSFTFSALDYTAPQKIRYAYTLEGLDKQWVETDAKNRQATYTHLDPGSYQFRVKATNVDGVWSPYEVNLGITILPPWWQTKLFLSIMVLTFLLLLFGIYQLRMQTIRQRHQLLEEQVAQRTIELKKREHDLRQAHDTAQRANRAKTDFLAMVTHEIRSPLNGILGMIQLLKTQPHAKVTQEKHEIIEDSAETLTTLVDDILNFSALEMGRPQLQNKPFSPLRVIKGVTNSFEVSIREKGLQLHTEIHLHPGEELVGDANRLRQILFNLLNNAIKFTHKGHIHVRANLDNDHQRSLLKIEVEDSGIGIEPHQIESIFTLFHQADPSSRRRQEGMGLGLAITQRIVQALDGVISVESQVNIGSCFYVHLPYLRGQSIQQDFRHKPSEHKQTLEILVVEDLAINREVLAGMLKSHNHEVTLAHDGTQALQLLKTKLYDLIFLDIRMPDMDGFEVLAKLRQQADTTLAQVAVYAYTANQTDPDGCQDYLQAGFNGVLAKPVRDTALTEILNDFGNPLGDLPATLPVQNLSDHTILDIPFIEQDRALLGTTKLQELTQLFEQNAQQIFSHIAQDIEEADTHSLRQRCHDLASGALNIGLHSLGQQAKSVENELLEKGWDGDVKKFESLTSLYHTSIHSLKAHLKHP